MIITISTNRRSNTLSHLACSVSTGPPTHQPTDPPTHRSTGPPLGAKPSRCRLILARYIPRLRPWTGVSYTLMQVLRPREPHISWPGIKTHNTQRSQRKDLLLTEAMSGGVRDYDCSQVTNATCCVIITEE